MFSTLNIEQSMPNFEDISSISVCSYPTIHTPIRLVSGYQCVTRIIDISISDDYPDILFFHVAIQGADDYLDCGGRVVEVDEGVMIPIKKDMFKDGEQYDLQNLKEKLKILHNSSFQIKAFRSHQWRVLSHQCQKIPLYSCVINQESGDLSFAESEPCCYSVHKEKGDLMVNTRKNPSTAETLGSYLDKLRVYVITV